MSSEVKLFEKAGFGSVRVVMKDGQPWFVARDVANVLGYADTTQAIRMHCEKANDYRGVEMTATATPMKIIPEEDVYALIFGSHLESAKQFRRWLCDEVLPSIRKTGIYSALPDFSNPAIAARAWAEQYERCQIAEAQRDEAIRTKAEIGSRREATAMAMATASAAVRKVDALEDELGRGKRYKAVKAIPWLLEEFIESRGMYSVVGKALRRMSSDLGYSVEKIMTPEFPDGVNAYHVDVIAAFRAELRQNPGMLDRYRRN